MKIKEIPFVGYPFTDVDRSRNFYENVLGLEPSMVLEIHEGQFWIEYNIAEGCLAISNMWQPSGSEGGPTMALEVDDLDKARQELLDADAANISDVMESSVCRFFLFSDPDGNPLMLHQVK